MYSDAVADAQYRQLYERFCQGDHRASIELVNLVTGYCVISAGAAFTQLRGR